jgi:hypothetical protein
MGVLRSEACDEGSTHPVRDVLRQAAIFGQRPEPEGVAHPEEAGECVVGIADVEDEQIDGSRPDGVLVVLAPDPGSWPAFDHSAQVG